MSEREDATLDAEMDQLMRTTPPMDAEVSARLLLEAKEIFDAQGVMFFLRQGHASERSATMRSSRGTTTSISEASWG